MGLNLVAVAIGFVLSASGIVKAHAAPATSAKKTICTITINSNQEKELFRKKLPSSDFRVVELIPDSAPGLAWIEGWAGANWFKKACERRVQCDILIISGHFAGTFFGRSGHSLSLNEMEKASCHASCDGIFKRPKEVYLFGCNTLADKTKDHRGPEDYVEVLRADGFSADEAHSIALQRYTPWGASNLDRMRSLFPNAVGLYGFTSISPLGKHIEGPLARFLDAKAKTYATDFAQMKNGDRNTALAKALSSFSFIQADTTVPAGQALVCRMSSKLEAQSMSSDLALITGQLNSAEPLNDLPQILERLRVYSQMAGKSWTAWKTSNAGLREKFREIFQSSELRSHFAVKLGVLELLSFLDAENVETEFEKFMSESLQNLGSHRSQEICAQRHSQLIRNFKLPSAIVDRVVAGAGKNKVKVETAFGALSCLNFEVSLDWIKKSYPEGFLYSQNWDKVQSQLLELLKASGNPGNPTFLIPILSSEKIGADVRAAVGQWFLKASETERFFKALQAARRLSDESLLLIIDLSRIGQDENLKGEWIQLWRGLRPGSEKIQQALFEHARREGDPSSWLAIFGGIELHPAVKNHLMGLIRDPKVEGRRFILNLLARLTPEGEGLYSLGLHSLKDPEAYVRAEAVDLMTRYFWEAVDPELEPQMLRLLKEEKNADVLDETLRFWAKRGTARQEVVEAIDQVWAAADEWSDLRLTATEVLSHLTVNSPVLIDLWWSRLMKAPSNSEVESQILMMLANAKWKTNPNQARLVARFQRDLKSEDPRRRSFAQKAILRNSNPDSSFLEAAARELEKTVKDQNWMSARELAFELESYRSNARVQRALRAFHAAVEETLEGDI